MWFRFCASLWLAPLRRRDIHAVRLRTFELDGRDLAEPEQLRTKESGDTMGLPRHRLQKRDRERLAR